MTLVELIDELNRVRAEHPDLADQDVTSPDGDYTTVRVSIPSEPTWTRTDGSTYQLTKGLIVG